MRYGDEPRPFVDDRPRAHDESCSRLRRRAGVRTRDVLGLHAEASDHRTGRGPEPRPVGLPPRAATGAHGRRRRPGTRCAAVRSPRRRTSAGRSERARLGVVLRHEGRLSGRRRRADRAARLVTRRGPRGGLEAVGGRGARRRRLPAPRRHDRDAGDRRRAGAEAPARRGRRAAGRRPRSCRTRSRVHPGLEKHPLPAAA